jgi:hypothetical protein
MLDEAYVITHEQSLICLRSDFVPVNIAVVANYSAHDNANQIKSTTGRYLTMFSPSDQSNFSPPTTDHSFVTLQPLIHSCVKRTSLSV